MISSAGDYRYEPILDTSIVDSTSISVDLPQGDPNFFLYRTSLGVTKAWVRIDVQALGGDGCDSTFDVQIQQGAAVPVRIERRPTEPTRISFTVPKNSCSLPPPTPPNLMRCEQVTQGFDLTTRMPPWAGPEVQRDYRTISDQLCADGVTRGAPGSALLVTDT